MLQSRKEVGIGKETLETRTFGKEGCGVVMCCPGGQRS
jgi:hypothetical protein